MLSDMGLMAGKGFSQDLASHTSMVKCFLIFGDWNKTQGAVYPDPARQCWLPLRLPFGPTCRVLQPAEPP